MPQKDVVGFVITVVTTLHRFSMYLVKTALLQYRAVVCLPLCSACFFWCTVQASRT